MSSKSRGPTKLIIRDRPWTWNQHWGGVHWSKRSREKSRVKALVFSAVRDQLGENVEPYQETVEVTFTFYNGGRAIDWDNLCIKPYQDALVGLLIEDDNPKFVRGGHILLRNDKEDPRLEIEIIPLTKRKGPV